MKSLRAFEAAARRGSFRAAAEELFVTQGAVAQTIRGLESDLAVRLFIRHARGVRLTEQGERYAQSVASVLEQLDAATRRLVGDMRPLTLSVPPSLATKWLVQRLPGGRVARA